MIWMEGSEDYKSARKAKQIENMARLKNKEYLKPVLISMRMSSSMISKTVFQLKKSRYLKISISLSLISISLSVFINIQLAREYSISDGKTRALFGIKELLQFGYQYYVCILGVESSPKICSDLK